MAFSVNLLSSVAQCDTLLTLKQRERKDLVLRLTTLNHQLDNWDDVASVEAELTSTNTFITTMGPAIAAMPAGDQKRRQENLLNRYESRANVLTTKVEDYGAIARLERELERDGVAAKIDLLDALVAAVTTRRSQL
ncbi:hypothetical protein EJV47_05000 [Hymenobacter gummosus]|uniref:Uncharacterized protein n=1 Tax=Hymenobacter gummosus TaxID=1776032 RepID=A0A3S0IR01_9BACT|nr:hypothetical protein [Hymenobacter gummosus]RTQ52374.1 hypothetical protein EJV47_05000 [Hymenobacter gummosus]